MSHVVSHRLKSNQNQIISHLMINMNKLQDKEAEILGKEF